MDRDQRLELAQRYTEMSEPELMDVAYAYDELTDDAQELLRDELKRRKLEMPAPQAPEPEGEIEPELYSEEDFPLLPQTHPEQRFCPVCVSTNVEPFAGRPTPAQEAEIAELHGEVWRCNNCKTLFGDADIEIPEGIDLDHLDEDDNEGSAR